jgi:hypothetical protein
MPHMVLLGTVDPEEVASRLPRTVYRMGRAVLKTEGRWLSDDRGAVLVEGVVVEFSRPLHPVALVAPHHDDTVVRLWSRVAVERTRPVQRWLCLLAAELQRLGGGPIKVTNIPDDLWSDLELAVQSTD